MTKFILLDWELVGGAVALSVVGKKTGDYSSSWVYFLLVWGSVRTSAFEVFCSRSDIVLLSFESLRISFLCVFFCISWYLFMASVTNVEIEASLKAKWLLKHIISQCMR